MEIKHLRTFCVLADELHFGRAAHRLHTAQPVISKRLREMEDELGARLLNRSARKVSLTRAGRAFLASARQALHHMDTAVRAARTGTEDGIERLTLGLMIGAALPAVGRMIARFQAANPLAEIEIVQVTERDLSTQLSSGKIDAAVCWDASVPSGLNTSTVATVPLYVLLPAGHPLEACSVISRGDLRGLGVIMPGRTDQPVIWERYRQSTLERGYEPEVLMKVATTVDMLAMVAGGVGIGLSPLPAGISYPGIAIRPQDPPYDLIYVLAWTAMSPTVKALLRSNEEPPTNAEPQEQSPRPALQ